VLSWRNQLFPETHAEGYSRLTYELETVGESVKLTVVHEIDKPDSKLIGMVSNGWPHILANLKSLLETGESLAETRHWPEGVWKGGLGLVVAIAKFSAAIIALCPQSCLPGQAPRGLAARAPGRGARTAPTRVWRTTPQQIPPPVSRART